MTETLPSMIADARGKVSEVPPADMGYENVEVLGGGLDAWTEAGLPVVRSE